jgi:hypothetical protein
MKTSTLYIPHIDSIGLHSTCTLAFPLVVVVQIKSPPKPCGDEYCSPPERRNPRSPSSITTWFGGGEVKVVVWVGRRGVLDGETVAITVGWTVADSEGVEVTVLTGVGVIVWDGKAVSVI